MYFFKYIYVCWINLKSLKLDKWIKINDIELAELAELTELTELTELIEFTKWSLKQYFY